MKSIRTIPMNTDCAEEVARHLTNEWVLYYVPPVDLISYNGSCFRSKYFWNILNVWNIFTTTYHPQTNGQIERYNTIILTALWNFIADHPLDWYLYTRALTCAYNLKLHTSTAIAPFYLVLPNPPGQLAVKRYAPKMRDDKSTKD